MTSIATQPEFKKGDYSRQELKALKKLKPQRGITAITAGLAKEWGRDPKTVHAKWYSIHRGEPGMINIHKERISPVSVAAPAPKNGVTPMSFSGVDFEAGRSRVNEIEDKSMRAGLDLAIKNELSNPKRGILFPKRLINRAKKYLADQYPQNAFSFASNGKKDKLNVVLVKRA